MIWMEVAGTRVWDTFTVMEGRQVRFLGLCSIEIAAVPAPTAVIWPFWSTVTTDGSPEDQTISGLVSSSRDGVTT